MAPLTHNFIKHQMQSSRSLLMLAAGGNCSNQFCSYAGEVRGKEGLTACVLVHPIKTLMRNQFFCDTVYSDDHISSL